MSSIDYSIIIPCFNEEKVIESTVTEVSQFTKKQFPNLKFELLIINDGSTDQTLSILNNLKSKMPELNVLSHPTNFGRGKAIKLGISKSVGKRLIMLDADLSYDVEHIADIINAFDRHHPDVVVISPYMKGGITKNVPFLRLMLSKAANWLLASFFSDKLSTVTCVVRGYNGDLLRSTPLFENGKELHLEILRKIYLMHGHILEIPGRLVWKSAKTRRRIKLNVFSSAKDHFLYAILMRPSRYLARLGFFLFLIGLYETTMILIMVISNYESKTDSWGRNLWFALSSAFSHSPHSVIIAVASLIVSLQILTFAGILEVLKLQQEEKMQHILALYREK